MKKLYLSFLLFFLLISCSRLVKNSSFLPPSDNFSPNRVKTIAVLPFTNLTTNKDLAKLVRISFYSHLTVRAFKDIELSTVDFILKRLKIKNLDINNKAQIKKIGNALKTDYLVYGKVVSNEKVFAAIYSLNSIEIDIQIVDTKKCNVVWHDRIIAKQHEGGVPTSILSIPFISASTTMNMEKSVTITLIEDSCRVLAYRIPGSLISKKKLKTNYIVQAGAFLLKEKAVNILKKIRDLGIPCYINKFHQWHRVILGPFESVNEAENVREKIDNSLKIHSIIKIVQQNN